MTENALSDAVLEMCSLFEDGPIESLAAAHAELVVRCRAALADAPAGDLRERFTAYTARWATAEAILAAPAAFVDQTQVLAAALGDAGLL